MKVYLDTNMLYFLLLKNNEVISPAVNAILSDYQIDNRASYFR